MLQHHLILLAPRGRYKNSHQPDLERPGQALSKSCQTVLALILVGRQVVMSPNTEA